MSLRCVCLLTPPSSHSNVSLLKNQAMALLVCQTSELYSRRLLTHVDVFSLLQTYADVTTYADVPLDLTRVLDVRAALTPLANHNLSSFVLVGSLTAPSPTTMEPVVLTSNTPWF